MNVNDQSNFSHCPVMLDESLSWLNVRSGGIFLDCTFGGGGHSSGILSANENNFVHALDRDPMAEHRANDVALRYKNFAFYHSNFADIANLQLPEFNGILMDLGVSSFQLDDALRGFSFKHHSPLDMRMDNSSGITAEQFLRYATEQELVVAIRDYGEEIFWKNIVKTIIDHRHDGALSYADTFADLIVRNLPKKHQKIHPATKVFQGIRIFVNDELRAIECALPLIFQRLAIGGRLVVISFHSLEDRIIKRFFNKMAGKSVDRYDSTYQQNRMSYGNILTKKPVLPTEFEINRNPRSRSAKLRVLEKTKNTDIKK